MALISFVLGGWVTSLVLAQRTDTCSDYELKETRLAGYRTGLIEVMSCKNHQWVRLNFYKPAEIKQDVANCRNAEQEIDDRAFKAWQKQNEGLRRNGLAPLPFIPINHDICHMQLSPDSH